MTPVSNTDDNSRKGMRRLGGQMLLPALLGMLALPLAGVAQERDRIATDRPDFVESSNVVGSGHVQIETSMAWDRTRADGVRARQFSTPTLLRVGISDTLELRLETAGRLKATSDDLTTGRHTVQSGFADVALGTKWHALDAAGRMPSVGVLAHVELDSGSVALRAPGASGSLAVVAEWELPDDWSLGLMPGLSYQCDEDGRRHLGGIFGIVLGKSWTERWRGFVEFSAPQIARSTHGGTQTAVDIGTAYLLTDTVQIDTALSRGLNKTTADWSLTIGLSAKF